jgi:ribosomal protein S18 acetylase RimI-like enzyme
MNSHSIRIERITDKTITSDSLHRLRALLNQLSSSANEKSLMSALSSPQTIILAAFINDILVGTASCVYSHCVTGTRVHVEDVVVDAGYRGKGIGSELIDHAIKCAKILDAKTIDLTSRPDREAANRLYKKLGFILRDTNVYRYNDSL